MVKLLVVTLKLRAGGGPDAASKLFSEVETRLSKLGAAVCKMELPDIPFTSVDNLDHLIQEVADGDPAVNKIWKDLRAELEGEHVQESAVKTAMYTIEQFGWDTQEHPCNNWVKIASIPRNIHQQIGAIDADYKEKNDDYKKFMKELRVIRNTRQAEWLASYATLSGAVSDSLKLLRQDGENALYLVVVLTMSSDEFVRVASERGFLVRRFQLTQEQHEKRYNEFAIMLEEEEHRTKEYKTWCREAQFKMERLYLHRLALRVAADSRARYEHCGFLPLVVWMSASADASGVKKVLQKFSGTMARSAMSPEDLRLYDSMGLGDGTDDVPYVSIQIDI